MQDISKEVKVCSICNSEYVGWGNNAQPVNDGRCCDLCNSMHVIPARLFGYSNIKKAAECQK